MTRPNDGMRRPRRLLALLLIALSLVGVLQHPAAGYGLLSEALATSAAQSLGSSAPNASFEPFLDIVPSSDGTELFIQVSGVGQLGGILFANLDTGPTGHKGGYTMTYSDTSQTHITTVPGFAPNVGVSGSLSITTTHGLSTGIVGFQREYITEPNEMFVSVDGRVQFSLVNPNTLPVGTYVVIVPSFAPPGPAPEGYRVVGQSYSVRASGALSTADKPMLVQWFYDPAELSGAAPETLAIFTWDAHQGRWDNLDGELSVDRSYLSASTMRFTTYALMAPITDRSLYLPLVQR
jgi:hypothetical protein